jgi:hypothetical protein
LPGISLNAVEASRQALNTEPNIREKWVVSLNRTRRQGVRARQRINYPPIAEFCNLSLALSGPSTA